MINVQGLTKIGEIAYQGLHRSVQLMLVACAILQGGRVLQG